MTARKKLIIIISLLVVVLIGAVLLFAFTRQKSTGVQLQHEEIVYSTDTPDESIENALNYNWTGSADEPKKISIDTMNVDAFIQRAGVDQHNKIAVPNSVHLAGWFTGSAQPGKNGLSIIAAHVNGINTDGLFKKLDTLKENDEFEVELGNGTKLRYRVLGSVTVPEAESASVLFSQNPKVTSQVNLITCGGVYDESTKTFSDRTIVSAELL